jgi:hypothetical protein
MNPDQIPPVPPVPTAAPVSTPVAPDPVAAAAPAAPAAAPQPEIVTMAAPRRSHLKTILAVLVVIILAALGAGYAWAYRGAETVLPAAGRALIEAGTVRTVASVDMTIEALGEKFSLSMDMEGDSDQTDPERPKMQMTANAEFYGVLMGGEMRLVDENFYLKLNKIPGAAIGGDPQVQEMVGQWFFLSLEDIATMTGEPVDFGGEDGSAEAAEEDLARLVDSGAVSFGAPSIAKFEGEYVREYDVSLDADKLGDFVVAEARDAATTTESKALVDELTPVISGVMPALSLADGTVRVGLFSGQLRSVEGTVFVDIAKIDQAALAAAAGEEVPEEEMEGKLSAKFSATYSRHGEPVSVEAPTGATSLANILSATESYIYDDASGAYYAEGDPYAPGNSTYGEIR